MFCKNIVKLNDLAFSSKNSNFSNQSGDGTGNKFKIRRLRAKGAGWAVRQRIGGRFRRWSGTYPEQEGAKRAIGAVQLHTGGGPERGGEQHGQCQVQGQWGLFLLFILFIKISCLCSTKKSLILIFILNLV